LLIVSNFKSAEIRLITNVHHVLYRTANPIKSL